MSSVTASSIVALQQAQTRHSAAVATLKAQHEMELSAVRMVENQARAATPGEGIGANLDRKA